MKDLEPQRSKSQRKEKPKERKGKYKGKERTHIFSLSSLSSGQGKKKTRKERKQQGRTGQERTRGGGSKVTFHLINLQEQLNTHTLSVLASRVLEWFVRHFIFMKKEVDEIFTSSEEQGAAVLLTTLQRVEVNSHSHESLLV